MKVVLICEGKTESVITAVLREFLAQRYDMAYPGQRNPNRLGIDPRPVHGLVQWSEGYLKDINRYLCDSDVKAVIVLTDVKPLYENAEDAIKKLSKNAPNSRFHVCAAQNDFEAWLLPYWDKIVSRLKIKKQYSWGVIEDINDTNPPSHRLESFYFRESKNKGIKSYSKVVEAKAILKDSDLVIAANSCPSLKHFLNTILKYANLPVLD
jgi:hypothetical protein